MRPVKILNNENYSIKRQRYRLIPTSFFSQIRFIFTLNQYTRESRTSNKLTSPVGGGGGEVEKNCLLIFNLKNKREKASAGKKREEDFL